MFSNVMDGSLLKLMLGGFHFFVRIVNFDLRNIILNQTNSFEILFFSITKLTMVSIHF
jgi:hypothetical protein